MAVALAERTARPAAANDTRARPASLLRFITCGSVDDGKSTLIGRLLYEAGALPDDVLASLVSDSATGGNVAEPIDYSLVVDGLQAEREQGITIDVAYRYFATPRRSFIVADTPGHEQYTRNMATGASGAELAVILIDARKGVLPQTRRHSLIVSLVGVRHVVVAINKIDLIGYDQARIAAVEQDYRAAVAGLGFETVTVIPVSARDGDNIAKPSERTPWYGGPTLLVWLETIEAGRQVSESGLLMPVQWVNRPDADFRGFSGTIASGTVHTGDQIIVLPSGTSAAVSRIVTFDGDLATSGQGQAVTLTLDRHIDVSRGDVIVAAARWGGFKPAAQQQAVVQLLVTADRRIATGDVFLAQIGSALASARVVEVLHATDVNTFVRRSTPHLAMNDLGHALLRFDRPLVIAPYSRSRELGALILIDRLTNATAAMGVVADGPDGDPDGDRVVSFRRAAGRTLEQAMGPHWRQDIVPAASWRIGSAILLGLAVYVATESPAWALATATLDAALRPLLRFVHRRLWADWRHQQVAKADRFNEGGDGI